MLTKDTLLDGLAQSQERRARDYRERFHQEQLARVHTEQAKEKKKIVKTDKTPSVAATR